MSYYKVINGLRWYYRLKQKKEVNGRIQRGLFSDHCRNTLTNSLIVALSYFDVLDKKIFRLYTVFKSYLEYGIYQLKLPQHERCFYEIILGENSQKPHFDLDINNISGSEKIDEMNVDGEKVKDNLIDNIIKVLKEKDITIDITKDILIYTSHGTKKQSYHIIVNNFCHANNMEAKAFYDEVIEHVFSEYVQWIDKAVYSPTQQFRIVGSQKIETNRIKTFQRSWSYHSKTIQHQYPEEPCGPEHEMVMQLESSIISYTGNCKFLPVFKSKKETTYYNDLNSSNDITTDDALEALQLVANAGKINVHDPGFPYKFNGIEGPIVLLKRIRASRCKLCNRIHENENPYLLIVGENKDVYFFCRRASKNKKLYLGRLVHVSDPDPDINNNDQIRINWTKNVVDKVQKLARNNINNKKQKKYVTGETEIDPKHKKMIIDLYLGK